MDRNVTLRRQLFEREILCQATKPAEGLHVLLTGGDKGHVGAVSTCLPGEEPTTHAFPGHKDQYISAPWAKKLAQTCREPVCVVCGIHYDNATPEQIRQILSTTDTMLHELLQLL